MAQFDVYRNANPAARARIPLLLDVQADLLRSLATRIVVPLCGPQVLGGKPAERLNPEFEVGGRKLVMLTPELAGIPRKALGERVANLAGERGAIIAALDLAFTGI
jgi:toxin CcdB